MANVTQSPWRMAGAAVFSGGVNTGEIPTIRGGQQTFSCYSGYNSGTVLACVPPRAGPIGVSGDLLVYSGAGRLNTVLVNQVLASGVNCYIYDAAYAMSGGPFVGSGHQLIGLIQSCGWVPAASGFAVPWSAQPLNVDFPFYSGLCVAVRSGVASFTLTFTPESNPASGGITN